MAKLAFIASDCYKANMSISAAEIYDPYDQSNAPQTALSGMFRVAAMTSTKRTQFSANTNAAITAVNTDTVSDTASDTTTEGTDSLDLLAPTTISWEQQVLRKLDAGLEGEAYNLIMTKLDGRPMDYVMNKLAEFKDEFTDRGFKDLARDIGNVMQMLSYDSLGLDADFYATGPNASGADNEMQKHHRHPVERHFDNQIMHPPQFVQPFLGLR